MSRREVLVPLTEAIPHLMCALFEEVAPLWRRRCDILAARQRAGPAPLISPQRQNRNTKQHPAGKAELVPRSVRISAIKKRAQVTRVAAAIPQCTVGPFQDPSWPPFPVFQRKEENQCPVRAPLPGS